ncbi:Adenylyl-sulfate kinase [Pararobbsia alpina]|jgi:predicted kinase|uniref:AAA family ATPase n=1 Tax=Pararobbsia alpina TaxID=621374 RepID=UPI0039A4FE4D
MLIVIGGLPGTGKTTLSRGLARALAGVHLRIDSIEQAILRARGGDTFVGVEGYVTAYAVAEDNLRLGLAVVADCVNPLAVTRDAWRDIGQRVGVPVIEVETVCSDVVKHQRRVETRQADIAGHRMPTWQDVLAHDYAPWDRERVVIDTARQTVAQALTALTELAASKKR